MVVNYSGSNESDHLQQLELIKDLKDQVTELKNEQKLIRKELTQLIETNGKLESKINILRDEKNEERDKTWKLIQKVILVKIGRAEFSDIKHQMSEVAKFFSFNKERTKQLVAFFQEEEDDL